MNTEDIVYLCGSMIKNIKDSAKDQNDFGQGYIAALQNLIDVLTKNV